MNKEKLTRRLDELQTQKQRLVECICREQEASIRLDGAILVLKELLDDEEKTEEIA